MSKLLTITQLSAELGVKARTVRSWMQDRKIPFIRTGYRTVLFAPDRVLAALSKFEIKSAGARK
jgi:excisionase family DNA binding protein